MSMVPHSILSAAYKAQHYSLHLGAVAFQRTARLFMKPSAEPRREDIETLRRRYAELLQRDLDNVRSGIYPATLLRFPVEEYARVLPALLRDLPRSYRRAKKRNYKDLPDEASSDRYPDYYRRNFHWQTDGYFSRRSAEIYDIGVEFLFGGTADVMRRQIMPPIYDHIRD
ncbi:MAG: class I SAM-dependent methyltransferase, partial [Deltaproteobacteria bacterium]|nr:class I SAM-dependent methyltransferase [Deltaproteobacteria bacterium]